MSEEPIHGTPFLNTGTRFHDVHLWYGHEALLRAIRTGESTGGLQTVLASHVQMRLQPEVRMQTIHVREGERSVPYYLTLFHEKVAPEMVNSREALDRVGRPTWMTYGALHTEPVSVPLYGNYRDRLREVALEQLERVWDLPNPISGGYRAHEHQAESIPLPTTGKGQPLDFAHEPDAHLYAFPSPSSPPETAATVIEPTGWVKGGKATVAIVATIALASGIGYLWHRHQQKKHSLQPDQSPPWAERLTAGASDTSLTAQR